MEAALAIIAAVGLAGAGSAGLGYFGYSTVLNNDALWATVPEPLKNELRNRGLAPGR